MFFLEFPEFVSILFQSLSTAKHAGSRRLFCVHAHNRHPQPQQIFWENFSYFYFHFFAAALSGSDGLTEPQPLCYSKENISLPGCTDTSAGRIPGRFGGIKP